ncbi:hypothetical protein OB920_12375 [Halobacteria archaeon HArc-gm2]|nr:hypothetical protein [Halobacteria archaeon HArc-gm2]
MNFSSDATVHETSVHEAVIYAVADADDVDPVDLAPLYETIDPEALDALFDGGCAGQVAFTYERHEVVVTGDRVTVDGVEVDVRPLRAAGVGEDSRASAAGQ